VVGGETVSEKRTVIIDGEEFEVELEPEGSGWTVKVGGETFQIEIPGQKATAPRRERRALSRASSGVVSSSIPGKVVTVEVEVGQMVQEGDVILILEAMKMQNEVAAPLTGTVVAVTCEVGQNVVANVPLVTIEAESTEGDEN
jgi:biotin carboxyl carrier protein